MKLPPLHGTVSSLVAVTATIGHIVDAAPSSSSSTSFLRDVMGKTAGGLSTRGRAASTNDALLAKAVPLDQYKATLRAQGLYLWGEENEDEDITRRLDEQAKYYYYQYNDDGKEDVGGQEAEDEQNDDDYYVSNSDYLSFNGFAIKYAKCQPVQRFSPNAVSSGEYSPMVLDDIVMLRLCPSFYCSDSREYGCSYDYADYAVNLRDYIRIMVRHKMDQEEQLCEYCQACGADVAGRQRRTEQQQYQKYYGDDSYGGGYGSACNGFNTYCFDSDGNAVCSNNNNRKLEDQDVNGNTLDAQGYLDIIDCVQVEGGYFIRPRCDGYTQKLSMGIFHDKFCSQYAGDSIDISSFNLGVDKYYFDEFAGQAGCMDCSETDYPPYFNANSNLCNRLDISAARCTSKLESNIFANSTNDDGSSSYSSASSSDCSYIDSLRIGTYDEKGQLFSSESLAVSRSVTRQQKILLSLALTICAFLAIYACYLHHAITNLLIKSLSHTDLLPPSRHRRRSPRSSSRSRRSSRSHSRRSHSRSSHSQRPVTDDEEDDDDDFEMKKGATNA